MAPDIGVRVPARRLVPIPGNTANPMAGRGAAKARGAVAGPRLRAGVASRLLERVVMDPRSAMPGDIAPVAGVVGG